MIGAHGICDGGAAVRREDGASGATVPAGVSAVPTDPDDVTERHLQVLDRVAGAPDLVLLPENGSGVAGLVEGFAPAERLAAQARRLRTTLVAGVVETEGDRFRNAAVLWSTDGRIAGRHEKEHRVPFGEYIPRPAPSSNRWPTPPRSSPATRSRASGTRCSPRTPDRRSGSSSPTR